MPGEGRLEEGTVFIKFTLRSSEVYTGEFENKR